MHDSGVGVSVNNEVGMCRELWGLVSFEHFMGLNSFVRFVGVVGFAR